MMAGLGLRRLASPVTANVLAGVVVLAVAAVIWLDVLTHMLDLGQNILNLVIFVTLGAVGVAVARAQPRNPVGWLLLGGALGLALSYAGGSYAVLVYQQGHRTLPFGGVAVLLNLRSPALARAGAGLGLAEPGVLNPGFMAF
jgi:hypothetical protein